jgi:hypothetical protein
VAEPRDLIPHDAVGTTVTHPQLLTVRRESEALWPARAFGRPSNGRAASSTRRATAHAAAHAAAAHAPHAAAAGRFGLCVHQHCKAFETLLKCMRPSNPIDGQAPLLQASQLGVGHVHVLTVRGDAARLREIGRSDASRAELPEDLARAREEAQAGGGRLGHEKRTASSSKSDYVGGMRKGIRSERVSEAQRLELAPLGTGLRSPESAYRGGG